MIPEQVPGAPRTRRLVMEIELPTMWVEDLPDAIEQAIPAEFGQDMGQEILNEIGEVSHGLLTLRIMGEKGDAMTRVPVIVRTARVEMAPPTPEGDWREHTDDLVERAEWADDV